MLLLEPLKRYCSVTVVPAGGEVNGNPVRLGLLVKNTRTEFSATVLALLNSLMSTNNSKQRWLPIATGGVVAVVGHGRWGIWLTLIEWVQFPVFVSNCTVPSVL